MTVGSAVRRLQAPQSTVGPYWDANLELPIHGHFAAQMTGRMIKRSSGRILTANTETERCISDCWREQSRNSETPRILCEVTQDRILINIS